MENNFKSLQYFLPELMLIITIISVIVTDLIPSVNYELENLNEIKNEINNLLKSDFKGK